MKLLILICIGALLSGCNKPQSPPPPAATAHAMSFLALGDSYTIGESVDESQRWPVQLSASLRQNSIDISDPTIIARTGWTTAQLSAAINSIDLHPPYDLVTLLIGVNNQYQGRSEDEYRTQFADLLARSIKLAGDRPARVMVLSIPDWGVTPFARSAGADANEVATAIDHFNAINKELTAKSGAAYVDITPLTRDHRELVADDGLHPTGAMYAKWVELTTPAAEKALRP